MLTLMLQFVFSYALQIWEYSNLRTTVWYSEHNVMFMDSSEQYINGQSIKPFATGVWSHMNTRLNLITDVVISKGT